jgi:hypothetical protein
MQGEFGFKKSSNEICVLLDYYAASSGDLYYIKNQQDATLAVLFISHCKITLHVSEPTRCNFGSIKALFIVPQ